MGRKCGRCKWNLSESTTWRCEHHESWSRR
jgi:hypothetical protein